MNKYLLIFLELVFRGTNFSKFGSIHSFSKHLLDTYFELGALFGAVDGQLTKQIKHLSLWNLYFRRVCLGSGGRQNIMSGTDMWYLLLYPFRKDDGGLLVSFPTLGKLQNNFEMLTQKERK